MKKTLSLVAAAAILALTPVLAGTAYAHGEDEASVSSHGHGSHKDEDDHSRIEVLDISPEEAIAALDTGLATLVAEIDASNADNVIAGALSLMSVVKTLQAANPNERQAAALRQLDQQLDNAKHAAEDGEFDKAKSAATRVESALKLYRAMQ